MTEGVGSVVSRVLAGYGGEPSDWSRNSDLIRRRVAVALLECSRAAEDAFHKHKSLCESPIECVTLAGLLALMPEAIVAASKEELKTIAIWEIAIIPQMPFKGYRLDFAVLHRPTKGLFALECDGRNFHLDKSKDVERDVNLWAGDCIAFHVSGSSLCRNPRLALEPFARKVRGQDGRETLV